MLPNFLCIGTYRSGTTWLYTVLREHPDIYLPEEKELMFFSHHYDKGLEWYERFYDNYRGQQIAGEICPTYLSCKKVPERIYRHIPDAKLIVILRNPADQVWSLYNLWLTRNYTDLDISDALRTRAELLNNVLYYKHLSNFLTCFDLKNVQISFFEDLERDPRTFLTTIYEFLGVDEYYPEGIPTDVNKYRRPRNSTLEKIVSGTGDFLRRRGLLGIKSFLNTTGLSQMVRRLNTSDAEKRQIPPDARELINDYVREEITKLEALARRDLSLWK